MRSSAGTFFVLIMTLSCTVFSQIVPFGFYKQTPALNWDFTSSTTLPSQLTFTRASTATYFDSTGVMKTAATNTARFDYDPITHQGLGLLMEGSATNMATCSQVMTLGSCWSDDTSGVTVTINAATAPDGTMTANKLVATTPGSDAFIFGTPPTTTIGVTYTYSVFLRSDVAGFTDLILQENSGSYTWFSVATVSVTTNWQRFTVTGSKTTSNGMRAVIALFHDDLQNVYAWGSQYEVGPIATSYIPTTASAVTRSADSLAFNTMTWFNPTSGSLFAEYTNLSADSSANYNVFGLFNTNVAGTFANNAIELADNNTTVASNVTTSSSAVFNPGGSVNAAGTINRQAITYKANNFSSSINRGAVTTGSSGALPSPAYGYIGSQPGGSIRNRYVRKIKYFNYPLANTDLQGL